MPANKKPRKKYKPRARLADPVGYVIEGFTEGYQVVLHFGRKKYRSETIHSRERDAKRVAESIGATPKDAQ